jgi:outer membrane protein OmpA-like peptidoglycan-associated protein
MRLAAATVLLALAGATAAADPVPGPLAPKRRVVVTDTSYEVIETIRFAGATATLAAESSKMLDAVARVLDGNPEIQLIEIRAYGAGPARGRQAVADARARAIADELVRRGIDAARLRTNGIARPPRGASGGPEFVIVRRRS